MLTAEALEELKGICGGAQGMSEAGNAFVYLPGLKVLTNNQVLIVDALLCLQARDGYPTRLFLSQPIPGKGSNWSQHRILDRTWHTWSWNYVGFDLRPAQILAEHLRALR